MELLFSIIGGHVSSASVKRMPSGWEPRHIVNVSYFLDNRFSGSPVHAANDECYHLQFIGNPHLDSNKDPREPGQEGESQTAQSGNPNPRKYPDADLEARIFEEVKKQTGLRLDSLKHFGPTLSEVVIKEAQNDSHFEKARQPTQHAPASVFFTYFGQLDYKADAFLPPLSTYFSPMYHSSQHSIPQLSGDYVKPNFINPNYKPRVRHRMRKQKSYKYRVITREAYSYSPLSVKSYPHVTYRYQISSTPSSALAPQTTRPTEEKQKPYRQEEKPQAEYRNVLHFSPERQRQRPYVLQAIREYSNGVVLPTTPQLRRNTTTRYDGSKLKNTPVPITETKQGKIGMRVPYLAFSQPISAPRNKVFYGGPSANQETYSTNTIEQKLEQTYLFSSIRRATIRLGNQRDRGLPLLGNCVSGNSSYDSESTGMSTIPYECKSEKLLNKYQQTSPHHRQVAFAAFAKGQTDHSPVASIDQLLQPVPINKIDALENIASLPRKEARSTRITPALSPYNGLFKPYRAMKGEIVENAFREDIAITDEALQRAASIGKDYLSVVYSELTRMGYKVGIVEQVYTDKITGQTAKGKKLVLLDHPDLNIEVLIGEKPDSTVFQSFVRHGDSPLTQLSKKRQYATILIKATDVYIKELDNRFEPPKKGRVSEPCYAPLAYQKAA